MTRLVIVGVDFMLFMIVLEHFIENNKSFMEIAGIVQVFTRPSFIIVRGRSHSMVLYFSLLSLNFYQSSLTFQNATTYHKFGRLLSVAMVLCYNPKAYNDEHATCKVEQKAERVFVNL